MRTTPYIPVKGVTRWDEAEAVKNAREHGLDLRVIQSGKRRKPVDIAAWKYADEVGCEVRVVWDDARQLWIALEVAPPRKRKRRIKRTIKRSRQRKRLR